MIKWIIFFNCILLYHNKICEDVIRPKKEEDCFKRTFVGEFNKNNSYCCFLSIDKGGETFDKCSIHFKSEIDGDAVFDTIEFLKYVNTHYVGEQVDIISLDCICKYIKLNYYIIIFFILFEILYN